MSKVCIIIPNYNGRDHLRLCCESILRQSFKDFNVTIVDNASSDDSLEFLSVNYPKFRVIRNSKNVGFAAAVNAGIKATSSEFIALLNNDTELDSQWLKHLVNSLEMDSTADFAASKMLDFSKRDIIDSAGDGLNVIFNPIARGTGMRENEFRNDRKYIFGSCAGAALYRRKLFEIIGYFDEDFFAWFEDADFNFRAQISGYKCIYIPSAVCYHKRGATAKTVTSNYIFLNSRNMMLYILKNFPWQILLLFSPLIIASRFRNFLMFVKQGFIKESLSAYRDVLSQWRTLIKKRKAIQRNRKVSLRYLFDLREKNSPKKVVT